MKLLYRRERENFDNAINMNVFVPSFKNGFFIAGEQKQIKNMLVRIVFMVLSFGKAKISYLTDDSGNLMHTSYVVPKCIKFPFMKKGDFEIGPCFTYPEFRGQGIYVKVIRSICSQIGNNKTVFYMIVDESNIASVKGIEKAGFQRCGEVKVSKILKRYYIVDRS